MREVPLQAARGRLLFLVMLASIPACGGAAASQAPVVVQPGAPGQPSRELSGSEVSALEAPTFGEADVRFMHGMIGHHAQALEMIELLRTRTESDDIRKLALRIELSQADEIRMMQDWLKSRGQSLPDPHAHHMDGAKLMPGMLSAGEMASLAAARGREFDRLFLELMIKHHEGALVMVRELFASEGAAQESEIYAFASDVEADQAMEIARMRAMLKELQR